MAAQVPEEVITILQVQAVPAAVLPAAVLLISVEAHSVEAVLQEAGSSRWIKKMHFARWIIPMREVRFYRELFVEQVSCRQLVRILFT